MREAPGTSLQAGRPADQAGAALPHRVAGNRIGAARWARAGQDRHRGGARSGQGYPRAGQRPARVGDHAGHRRGRAQGRRAHISMCRWARAATRCASRSPMPSARKPRPSCSTTKAKATSTSAARCTSWPSASTAIRPWAIPAATARRAATCALPAPTRAPGRTPPSGGSGRRTARSSSTCWSTAPATRMRRRPPTSPMPSMLLRAGQDTDTVLVFIAGHGINDGADYRFLATNAERTATAPCAARPWCRGRSCRGRWRRPRAGACCSSTPATRAMPTARSSATRLPRQHHHLCLGALRPGGAGGRASSATASSPTRWRRAWTARRGGGKREITTKDLAQYVIKRVDELAKDMKGEQEPQYFRGRDAEDYVLARP